MTASNPTLTELKTLIQKCDRETWEWVRQLVRSEIERRTATS